MSSLQPRTHPDTTATAARDTRDTNEQAETLHVLFGAMQGLIMMRRTNAQMEDACSRLGHYDHLASVQPPTDPPPSSLSAAAANEAAASPPAPAVSGAWAGATDELVPPLTMLMPQKGDAARVDADDDQEVESPGVGCGERGSKRPREQTEVEEEDPAYRHPPPPPPVSFNGGMQVDMTKVSWVIKNDNARARNFRHANETSASEVPAKMRVYKTNNALRTDKITVKKCVGPLPVQVFIRDATRGDTHHMVSLRFPDLGAVSDKDDRTAVVCFDATGNPVRSDDRAVTWLCKLERTVNQVSHMHIMLYNASYHLEGVLPSLKQELFC